MAETNTTGAFWGSDVRARQLGGYWPTTYQPATPPGELYGWFGGGKPSPSIDASLVDRIEYANDTATASVRGPLTVVRHRFTAAGNGNYGWFGGGRPDVLSSVDRVDYASDSSTASARGPLSAARYLLAATGNTDYGWFGGGGNGTPSVLSTVDRITYSSDTGTAGVRGSLYEIIFQLAATGNSNYGWFGGGTINNGPVPTQRSYLTRITYSSDLSTSSVRGNLNSTVVAPAAAGNSNYGWWGGGVDQINSLLLSRVDRVDYASDTGLASVRGPLTVNRYLFTATGNADYGYFGAGSPNLMSSVDRITYASDSTAASSRGPLSAGRYGLAATGGYPG